MIRLGSVCSNMCSTYLIYLTLALTSGSNTSQIRKPTSHLYYRFYLLINSDALHFWQDHCYANNNHFPLQQHVDINLNCVMKKKTNTQITWHAAKLRQQVSVCLMLSYFKSRPLHDSVQQSCQLHKTSFAFRHVTAKFIIFVK
jgi:hypothetical protein